MNNLKLAGARLVVEIVSETMRVTGITGYRRDSRYSVERHLRDAYGAGLMISNDRIYRRQRSHAARGEGCLRPG